MVKSHDSRWTHIESTCTRAHDKTDLIESSDTTGSICGLAVHELRSHISCADHRRQLGIPRTKFLWSDLHECKHRRRNGKAVPTSYTTSFSDSEVEFVSLGPTESATIMGKGMEWFR